MVMNIYNMKNLFLINEEEKNRILNLHETATKRHYLSEQQTTGYVIRLTESDLKKTIKKVLLREDVEALPDMGNFPLGKVEAVQQALVDAGYYIGPTGVDDIYGKYTRAAVIKYQKDNGIKQTGNVGPVTSKRLGVQQLTSGKPLVKDKTNVEKQKKTDNKVKTNVILSNKINPTFKSKIDTSKLSTSRPVEIFDAGQDNCATFVHQFVDGLGDVGDAWIAYDNSRLGNTIMSSFNSLNSDQIDKVTDLWKDINKAGGGKEKGPFNGEVVNIVNNLVPKTPNVSLKLNDIVGLFYPGSKHHEEAFYDAGKGFFRKNMLGMTVNGETIKKGIGWGMNTHIGVVGAIKDGVPIVFHNIGGQVWADPYNNLKGGSRIAWVKRA